MSLENCEEEVWLFGDEHEWAAGSRATLYCATMGYSFLGVSIVADRFVQAIEIITSRKKKVKLPSGQFAVQQVWNLTVANLSLMALGSSAPEICLSVVEIINKGMKAGALGPATIVGSGAFNLLVIIAVCIMCIPSGEGRAIHELSAFYVTAAFSVVAYGWLCFILVGTSPSIIDVWEAVVTLALLPALLWTSYKVDIAEVDAIPLLRTLVRWTENASGHEQTLQTSLEGTLQMQEEEEEESRLVTFSRNPLVRGALRSRTFDLELSLDTLQYGEARCSYRTEPLTATEGCDYVHVEGEVEFAAGSGKQCIELTILPRNEWQPECEFIVVFESSEGCHFLDPDGEKAESDAIIVTIGQTTSVSQPPWDSPLWMCLYRYIDTHAWKLAFFDWYEYMVNLRYCNGGPEEQAEASAADWCYHVLALPWNIVFLFIPPPVLFGGWACFFVCLLCILGVTAIIADVAELFGCVLGLPHIITAISIVALGTSMPDLFASISAAKEDPQADASIVNVTGSNSVNVYLGLGLPWTIASIYWAVNGRTADWEASYPDVAASIEGAAFVVPSSDLGFSVFAFTCCSLVGLFVLVLRRRFLGCELGGPHLAKVSSAGLFILLWLLYLAVAFWRILRCDAVDDSGSCRAPTVEQVLVLTGAACFMIVATTVVVVIIVRSRSWNLADIGAADSSPEACFEVESARKKVPTIFEAQEEEADVATATTAAEAGEPDGDTLAVDAVLIDTQEDAEVMVAAEGREMSAGQVPDEDVIQPVWPADAGPERVPPPADRIELPSPRAMTLAGGASHSSPAVL
eukprot:TRINITY_DN28216_c0_g1_i3.p1 TRINITY_DN28216_c0_g1~~TRINITY_DN28216_c0_g1_i3.p1  ORF type:complete len:802 (+),score=123.26 TRINITY_DN28216_c0_g1_i3:87-2492(+)